MIYIENHRCKQASLQKRYPNATIIDLTSKSTDAVELSPFYPHGGIPVPFSPQNVTSMSVEGVWQGLKVFQTEGIDTKCFLNDSMQGLKRTVRTRGQCLGHQRGVNGQDKPLLDYTAARRDIYLPTYYWMMENCASAARVVRKLGEMAEKQDLVFLDYNTNEDIDDPTRPLSHASLVKRYIECHYSVLPEGKSRPTQRSLFDE